MNLKSTEHGTTTTAPPPRPSDWQVRDPSAPVEPRARFAVYGEMSRVMLLAFVRDKAAIFFLLIFPLMFLLLFGTLFRGGGTAHATVAQIGAIPVLDSVTGAERVQLDKSLTVTKFTDSALALQKVKDGDLDGVIEQAPGNTFELHYSSANPAQAVALRSIVNALVQEVNVTATGRPPTYTLVETQVEDVSLKPIQYLTPGLLGWAIATGAVFSSALTLITLRQRQILRRIRLAPVSPAVVVLSRILITSLIALAQTALFLTAATLPFFGLQLSGDWWLIIPLVLSATLAFMSVGMLAGSLAKTEETANGLANLIVLPMSFLSGSFFSLDAAPAWLRQVANLLPLRWLVTSSETVLVRGGGIVDVLPTIGGMFLFSALVCGIAWHFFSWDD